MTQSRSVLVSGASTGIGRATALYLARQEGFQVFAGVRTARDAELFKQENVSNLTPVMLDVTDEQSIRRIAQRINKLTDGKGLYALVNNAGVSLSSPQELVTMQHIRAQFDVNVFGLMQLTAACLPMIRANQGRIVNVSSGAGRMATPLMGTYSASKFAVEGLSDALRVELRPWKIPVVVIEPGFVQSDIHGKNDADMEGLLANMPKDAPAEYRSMLEAFLGMNRKLIPKATAAEVVAQTIGMALTIDCPATRYAVGADAKLMKLLYRILPDRIKDLMFAKAIGL
ncbi:MAG: SDR family oxidoreductase [Gammaproteobacteria bacterium]|nr:MAG: SDR family oxidoreductase [Gammaproteobacteria bacterium]